jgi:hypothetical protein
MFQSIITYIIIVSAAAYAVYRMIIACKQAGKNISCDGCSACNGCAACTAKKELLDRIKKG